MGSDPHSNWFLADCYHWPKKGGFKCCVDSLHSSVLIFCICMCVLWKVLFSLVVLVTCFRNWTMDVHVCGNKHRICRSYIALWRLETFTHMRTSYVVWSPWQGPAEEWVSTGSSRLTTLLKVSGSKFALAIVIGSPKFVLPNRKCIVGCVFNICSSQDEFLSTLLSC